jgi:transposase
VAPHIIDKGIATNLLAQVLISKYADHLPLYRQQQIYARAGVDLPRSTLADWVGRCGLELTPLVSRLRELLHQENVLHGDESRYPCWRRVRRRYIGPMCGRMPAPGSQEPRG